MLCRLSYAGLAEVELYPETGRSSSPQHVSRRSGLLKYSHFPASVKCATACAAGRSRSGRQWAWICRQAAPQPAGDRLESPRMVHGSFTSTSQTCRHFSGNRNADPFSPLSLGSQCCRALAPFSLQELGTREHGTWRVPENTADPKYVQAALLALGRIPVRTLT